MMRKRAWPVFTALALVAVAVFAIFAQPLARLAAAQGLRAALGLHIAYTHLEMHPNRLAATNLRITNAAGEPVADIASLSLHYSVRDLLPGSARMFGLSNFDIERARITIIRHKDGSLNIPIPKSQNNARPSTTPYIFTGRMRDVAVQFYDGAQGVPAARRLSVANINGDFDIATNARSRYRVALNYVENGRNFPVTGTGDVDTTAGVGSQEWRAQTLPIARMVDIALNNPSFHVVGGSLKNLDARILSVADSGGALRNHLSATATLDRARVAIGGLAKPLQNVNGPLAAYSNGFLLEKVNATIAGVPVSLDGGVYNFTAPAFRLNVSGRGDLRKLRNVLAQSASLPLSGPAQLNVRVEGAASNPLILIALDSARANFRAMPIDRASGTIAFDGQEADVIDFTARYGGIAVRSHGRLAFHARANALQMLAGIDAPPNALPYAATLVPGMPVHAAVLASGNDLRNVDSRGVITGRSGAKTLAALFDVRRDGVGTVGPIRIDAPGQALYAIAGVDHPHDRIDAVVRASHVRLQTQDSPALPSMRVPALPPLAATLDGTMAGSLQRGRTMGSGSALLSNVRTQYGDVAHARVTVGSTAHSALAASVDASGIGPVGAVLSALMSYDRGTLHVRDAAASLPSAFADVRGDVAGIASGTPKLNVRANVHAADISPLVALAQPRAARLAEGSADGRFQLSGAASAPTIAGTLQLPEGAINGLPFHDARAGIAGSPSAIEFSNGSVVVGDTALAFSGNAAATSQAMAISAPHADLTDFNDFFDAGDMLGGTGNVRASVAMRGGSIAATSGNVALHDTKFRNFPLGTANAAWRGAGSRIATAIALDGELGRLSARGSVGLDGSVAMTAHARNVDLARSLPISGITMPIAGFADADAVANGRYPNLDTELSAQIVHGAVGRIPVRQFALNASTRAGYGRLARATLAIPNAHMSGSGTFGLHASDPLGLAFHASAPDVGKLATTLTGKPVDAAGRLETTLHVRGTRAHPLLDDDFTLIAARYARFTLPRAAGSVHVDERTAAIHSLDLNLERGQIVAAAEVPLQLSPLQLDPHNRPIAGSIVADDVEASDVADLLPKGSKIGGRLDGRMTIGGSVRAPQMGGSFNFSKGYFSGPQERVPVENARARIAFNGTSATLSGLHADLGRGAVDADGTASVPDLRDARRATVALHATARDAQLDMPSYIKGRFSADVTANRRPGSRPVLAGTVATDSARIPLSALYNPAPADAPKSAPPDLAFNLHVRAGRDVRVISPNVDVGAQGAADVTGTLAAPQLAGTFESTGGTVSFFRTFRIESGTVNFPGDGIIPTIDAVATSYVSDPSTDIALRVTGPATNMNIAFTSDPPYDRAQILGLLVNAQSLGAVQGVATSGAPASNSSAISNLAAGQLNGLFTRNLLEPLSVALGGGLGLQNLQITNDLQGGLGVHAVKAFGKDVNVVFADSFNEPRRQSLSLQAHPNAATQFELTLFNSSASNLVALDQPFITSSASSDNATTFPLDSGTNGFKVRLERKFP